MYKRVIRALIGSWLLGAICLEATPHPIGLTVSPKSSFEPATIRLRVRIPLHAENVKYLVDLGSPTYYSGSEYPLHGAEEAPVFVLTFRGLRAGDYQVRASLIRHAERYYQAGSAVTSFAVVSP